MFMGSVIGCRSTTIRHPPSGLAKNIILNALEGERWREIQTQVFVMPGSPMILR
jgi:hypothetical protein